MSATATEMKPVSQSTQASQSFIKYRIVPVSPVADSPHCGELLRQLSAEAGCPVGFVDGDPDKLGIKINGIKVLGNSDALASLISKYAVECVLIAIPSAKGSAIERIVDKCRECKVSFKVLPPNQGALQPAGIGYTSAQAPHRRPPQPAGGSCRTGPNSHPH
jgi:CoA-binding domain